MYVYRLARAWRNDGRTSTERAAERSARRNSIVGARPHQGMQRARDERRRVAGVTTVRVRAYVRRSIEERASAAV